MRCLLVAALVTAACAAAPCLAQVGPLGKKLIEYGWDVPTPAQMRGAEAEMEKRPFEGLVYRLAGGFNAFEPKPLQRAKYAEDEAALKALRFTRFQHNFVLMWGSAGKDWDWFDDARWRTVEANARLITRVARTAPLHGICFDPEPYDFNPWEYAKQAGASTRSFAEFRAQVRRRGAALMRALEKEMPGAVILTFFHVSLLGGLADEPDAAKLEAALKAQGWGLMPDFLVGMLEGASPRARFIDGNELAYYYTTREEYFRAYNLIKLRALNLVPPALRDKYRRQVQAGNALYVDQNFALRQPNTQDYLSFRLTPEERARWFEHNAYYALYTSDEYVWCYSERMNWWKNEMPPGLEQAVVNARRKLDEGRPLGFDIEPLLAEAARRPVPGK